MAAQRFIFGCDTTRVCHGGLVNMFAFDEKAGAFDDWRGREGEGFTFGSGEIRRL